MWWNIHETGELSRGLVVEARETGSFRARCVLRVSHVELLDRLNHAMQVSLNRIIRSLHFISVFGE